MVNVTDRTMMVTLNGELLFNERGSELVARDFVISDGLCCSFIILFQFYFINMPILIFLFLHTTPHFIIHFPTFDPLYCLYIF